ncbi:MAG: helix-turn-helix domain-containing protein [Candidatus Kapabacteria bacterium]|nr:helix-turn-helix domain-containing protein [Candidatus Kapabacteria bacterium]
MEKLIQITDQETFICQMRQMIREELYSIINMKSQAQAEDKILTRDEVLELYHLSPVSLWKRMCEGSIPHFRIGRRVYFKKSELDAINN